MKELFDDKKIFKNISKFDFNCQQCSSCCRHDPGIVLLTEDDVNKLCISLNMPLPEFIQKCCREVYRDGDIYVGLKEKSNFDCIFWSNGCIVYNDRPLQCRTYPYWPYLIMSCENWNAEKKRCKGLDKKGNLSVKERFQLYKSEKNAVYMKMNNDLNAPINF